MRLPNLIVAGAGKCGSTAFYTWLDAHPEVCGSIPKEPCYFIDLNTPFFHPEANYHKHGLEGYASFFQHCSPQTKIWFEASPQYYFQKTALDFFATCQPQPHVIFLLRKPSKRIFSNFSFVQNNKSLLAKDVSFAQFVDLLLEDKVEQIKDRVYHERPFFVLDNLLVHSRYYDYLARWAERFPPNRINILIFEQMIAEPRATLRSLASDLGIDPDFYNQFDFPKENRTLTIKNSWIHRNIRKVYPYLPASPLRSALKSFYLKAQTKNTSPPTPEPESMRRLDDYFVPYNRQLAQAFDLNLDCWQ